MRCTHADLALFRCGDGSPSRIATRTGPALWTSPIAGARALLLGFLVPTVSLSPINDEARARNAFLRLDKKAEIAQYSDAQYAARLQSDDWSREVCALRWKRLPPHCVASRWGTVQRRGSGCDAAECRRRTT